MENDTQDFIESHCLMTSMDKYNSKGQKMTHKDRKWPTRIESDPQGQKMTHKDRKWPAGARDFNAFFVNHLSSKGCKLYTVKTY